MYIFSLETVKLVRGDKRLSGGTRPPRGTAKKRGGRGGGERALGVGGGGGGGGGGKRGEDSLKPEFVYDR